MSGINKTILEAWPELKDDMENFLSDTDAWVIDNLKKAYSAKDWDAVSRLLEIMEFVHNLSHGH